MSRTEPSTPPAGQATAGPVTAIPVERIRPGRGQARVRFDAQALAELAASIAESGVIQPVVVCGDNARGYELLAGERRWRAAQRAGLDRLPAIVRNDLAAGEAAVLGLIENLQRDSLGILETAQGLARLGEIHGLTHAEIARRIGKSRVYVTNTLRLCGLAAPVKTLLEAGQLSPGHGKILAGLDPIRQAELGGKAARRGWSVRYLERAAATRWPAATRAVADPDPDRDMRELETRLSEHIGNPVSVTYDADRRRGELKIGFHDLDEFDGLLARLGYHGD